MTRQHFKLEYPRGNLFQSRLARAWVAPNGRATGVGCSACHGDWSLFAHEICRHAPSITAETCVQRRGHRGYGIFRPSVHEGGPFARATRIPDARINSSVLEHNGASRYVVIGQIWKMRGNMRARTRCPASGQILSNSQLAPKSTSTSNFQLLYENVVFDINKKNLRQK